MTSSYYRCAACGVRCGMMGHGKCEKGDENARLHAEEKPPRWRFGREISSNESISEILTELDLNPAGENDPAVLREAVIKLKRKADELEAEAIAFSGGDE